MQPADTEAHPEIAAPLTGLELGRASLTYALGGLAYKGVALLSVPILARLLSPAELGVLDLAAVLASIVALTVTVGTDQGIAYHEPRSGSAGALWSSALALVGAGGFLAVLLGIVVREPLAELLTGQASDAPIIAAAAIYGVVMAISGFTLVTIRLRGTARTYAVASFLIVTAEMAAALGLAWLLAAPVALMVLGWAAGAALLATPALLRHLPRLVRPRMATVRDLAAFGLPLVPAVIAWLIGDVWIRSTLAREAELAVLGQYGIAFRLASVLGLVVAGFGVAWYPYLYRSPPESVGERANRMLAAVVAALGGAAIALTLLAPELITAVAGDPYADGRLAVASLGGGMVVMGALVLVSGVIGSSGATGRVALAALIGAAAQGVGAMILIPAAGLVGAGAASLIGYGVAFAVAAFLVRDRMFASAPIAPVVVAVMVTAGLLAAHQLQEAPLILRLVLAAGAAGAGAGVAARSRSSSTGRPA